MYVVVCSHSFLQRIHYWLHFSWWRNITERRWTILEIYILKKKYCIEWKDIQRNLKWILLDLTLPTLSIDYSSNRKIQRNVQRSNRILCMNLLEMDLFYWWSFKRSNWKKLIGSYNLIKIFLASLNQSISFLTNNLFRKIAAIENGSIQKMIKRPLLLANGSSRLESFHSLNHYLHMGNFLFLGENFQNNLLGRSLINCLCFQNSFSSLSFV